jgi:hypothetical protein
MASALTQDKINRELQKADLPMVTMLEAPKASTAVLPVGPSKEDNQQKTSIAAVTSNNSTTIAAAVAAVVVVAVLLAGALFWRRWALTKLQGSKPYKLSAAAEAAAAAAANDSEQSDSTYVMDICEHNRLKSTCQLCGAGAFGLAGASDRRETLSILSNPNTLREDPLSEPFHSIVQANTRKPEEEPDESVYIVQEQEQVDFDAVFMDISPSPAAFSSKRDTQNSPVKISAHEIVRGMTPTNVDARGQMKSTKVQNLVQTFETGAVSVSADHGLVVKRRELDGLSGEHVATVRERISKWKVAEKAAAQTSTEHGQ